VRCAWINEQRDFYPMGLLCRVLKVSRSGYYAWWRREPNAAGRLPGPESKRPTSLQACERAVTSTAWLSVGSRAPSAESTSATSGPGPSS